MCEDGCGAACAGTGNAGVDFRQNKSLCSSFERLGMEIVEHMGDGDGEFWKDGCAARLTL